jgi:hypothetical protein
LLDEIPGLNRELREIVCIPLYGILYSGILRKERGFADEEE